jgi:hypothetical protein
MLLQLREEYRPIVIVVWIMVGTGCVVGGCSNGQIAENSKSPDSFPIVVPAGDLDLGIVWATCGLSHTLHLRNVSSRRVELASFLTTCGCVAVEPSSPTIAPKGQCDVTLKLRIASELDGDAKLKEPNFRTQLVPIIRGYPGSPPQWELTGTIRRLLSLSASSLQFDEPLIQGRSFPRREVRIVSKAPLQSVEAEGGSAFAACDLTRESETVYVLHIQPSNTLPIGPFHFDITLIPCLRSGRKIRTDLLAVSGWVSHEVEASPRMLHLGMLRVGQASESRVVVRSLIGKPFTLKSIIPDSKDTQVQVEASGDNGVTLRITHRVVASGDRTDNVAVAVENYDGRTFQFPIPICCHGLDEEDKN